MRPTFPFATVLWVCLLAVPSQSSADLISDTLSGMSANSWQKLNINAIQSVFTPLAQRPTTASPSSNISAWSGAAWDSGRSNLYIWGGDIGNEEGNEVYIFSGKSGLWSRGSLPSQITSTNGIPHTVDGVMNAPLSGESWDNVVFLNNVNRMAVIGVSREGRTWRDPGTGLFTGPYFWDPAKADPNKVSGLTGSQVNPSAYPDVVGGQMWQNRDQPMGTSSRHLQGTTAYVDIDGKDVVYVTDSFDNLWRYTVHDLDPANDTWERVGRRPITGASGWGAATIDTTNNLYLKTLTATSFGFWDLDRPDDPLENREVQVRPIIEPDTVAPDFRNFGVQFDPILGVFMLWDGSGSVWMLSPPEDLDSDDDGFLDLATGWLLEEIDVSGPGPSIPSAYTGVYGKWLYLEEYNAYLGVIDGMSGDVFLYKAFSSEVPAPVPEPGTFAMLFVGLLGIFASSKAKPRRA